MEDFTDNKREKENTIIFVEGISDLAFLSLLMNVKGIMKMLNLGTVKMYNLCIFFFLVFFGFFLMEVVWWVATL